MRNTSLSLDEIMWKISYQKLMAILLSSRYIPKDKEEVGGKELLSLLKQKQNK